MTWPPLAKLTYSGNHGAKSGQNDRLRQVINTKDFERKKKNLGTKLGKS